MVQKYFPKVLIFCVVTFFTVSVSNAQVGIGTVTPKGVLDLNNDSGTNKYGLVLPRVALTRTDLASPVLNPQGGDPAIGTVVYNTSTTNFGSESVYPGIYMWDGIDWINEFPKKNAEIFKQTGSSLRTYTTGSYQDIPNLVGRTFKPAYTGTYKIEVSVNWGGGYVNDSGFGTDVAVMTGNFKFTFDGVDKLIPAHTWSGRHGGGTQYYDIWEQTTMVIYKELVANTSYIFSLSFDQTVADGFYNNGNSGGNSGGVPNPGGGWLGGDIPCTVEFVFLD
ncbi:hypothetical protein [Aequorivita nionensis]|uniref:hypothetical protein n=1 Tax=Aequorivita nionensis TaxID=1287690 RepID=UPI003965C8F7